MADETSHPTHLEPSQLGTKEYWDSLYTTEISNHAANPSDTGTVWFSDSNAESKILSHLSSLSKPSASSTQQQQQQQQQKPVLSKETTSFLDLGCGNGSLLLALRSAGWQGPCLGVDYSPHSIALAKQVARTEAEEEGEDILDGLDFKEWDVIAGEYDSVLEPTTRKEAEKGGVATKGWDVVLDKGTFDAISLSDEKDSQGRRLFESYRNRVLPLVKPGTGLFVLTSCNWTEEELRKWFVTEGDDGFEVASRVEYRTFSFGGVKGQTISTLCFRRRG
ncbi:hypothetical protein NLU13_6935 [Sarocladium strictum]|uniref:Protein-lysine N-methyltransferase EFM4 n=1 Tax=Sarocladium strictum TaxID=5046 RepID=A0AA39L6A5_SARSR|nr:hypothetical protein NLU13_6935 [Sarocladium strictum]